MLLRNMLNKKPVRVIRGAKGDQSWSPEDGFIYCGLYKVVACWVEPGTEPHCPGCKLVVRGWGGKSGFEVIRFAFTPSWMIKTPEEGKKA